MPRPLPSRLPRVSSNPLLSALGEKKKENVFFTIYRERILFSFLLPFLFLPLSFPLNFVFRHPPSAYLPRLIFGEKTSGFPATRLYLVLLFSFLFFSILFFFEKHIHGFIRVNNAFK